METLQRTANRGSVSTGFNINNSLKLEDDNTENLYRALNGSTSTTKFTVSMWFKRTELGASQLLYHRGVAGNEGVFLRTSTETNDALQVDIGGSSTNSRSYTAALLRDTSAWYHAVLAVDTTQSTATNRFKLYLNGNLITTFASRANPAEDFAMEVSSAKHRHGAYNDTDGYAGYCGYIAECHYIDGSQVAQTEFGEVDSDSGIWKPKAYAGSYGTGGYYLDFEASGDLGANAEGDGVDFTLNNIAAADQATDTPTNSFCTLNTLSYNHPITLTEGNTKYVKSDSTYGMISGTHYVGAGKWYWEVKATDFGTYSACHFGILDAAKTTVSADERGYEDPSLAATNPEILVMSGAPNNWVMNSNATITNNGAMSSVDYTFNEGDILAIALDMDNGAFWFGNSRYSGVANGSFWVAPGGTTNSGNVAITDPTNGNYALVGDGGGTNNGTPNFNGGTITGGSLLTAGFTLVTPIMGAYHDGVSVTLEANFGGYNSYAEDGGYADANGHGNFAYAVPSGFYALCTKNIAEFGGSG